MRRLPDNGFMMPNSAETVAKETVANLCRELIGVHPQATGLKLIPIIQDALTTFAAKQVALVRQERDELEQCLASCENQHARLMQERDILKAAVQATWKEAAMAATECATIWFEEGNLRVAASYDSLANEFRSRAQR